jgi:hypothetical protein
VWLLGEAYCLLLLLELEVACCHGGVLGAAWSCLPLVAHQLLLLHCCQPAAGHCCHPLLLLLRRRQVLAGPWLPGHLQDSSGSATHT